jgi:cytochrome c peroxidase
MAQEGAMNASLLALMCAIAPGLAGGDGSDPDWCGLAPGLAPADCARVPSLLLPETLPPARGNAVGNSLPAAWLGYAIFYDARFSGPGDMRCATCHAPEDAFGDGVALPGARSLIPRNSPSLLNAAWSRWQFWDGRADTLWSQPLFALENPLEMNLTRLELLQRIGALYRAPYEDVFGPLPALEGLPPTGKPGDAAFDALSPEVQRAVDTVAANVGKALEAYMRQLAAGRAPLDLHLLGNPHILTPSAKHGIAVFVQAGCLDCHSGPAFTDDSFHNLGVPPVDGLPLDPGRAGGLVTWAVNPFNAAGPFFDGPPESPPPETGPGVDALGAFKTPSLRNLSRSAPYGHTGAFATLEEVVDFHLRGGGGARPGTLGRVDPKLVPRALSEEDRAALLEFLGTLDGTYRGDPTSPPNWWAWPDR